MSEKLKQQLILWGEAAVTIFVIATVWSLAMQTNILRLFLWMPMWRQALAVLAFGVAGFLIVGGVHVMRDGIRMIQRSIRQRREGP